MSYNPNDIFPAAVPPIQIDLYTLVESLDSSQDTPVVYSFGSGAPTELKIGERMILDGKLTGSFNSTGTGVSGAFGRMFVEFAPPYYPASQQGDNP